MAKYLKSDSEKGYVEDYVDIQALKFDNVRHVALGNMLGDYDNEGNYIVDPKIVEELIAMPKYVVEVMDNLEICLSVVKFDKQLSFLIAFEGEKATLSLLEKVSFEANNKLDSGTWSNVNEYVLDVVETIGEVDRQALYLKWNVKTFPGNIIDIFNCEDDVLAKYFNIITRIKYNMEIKSDLLEKEDELEEMEAEYALDMFTILQGYPGLLKLIQEQLKKEMTEKKDFVKLDRPNFSKTFNELFNKAIDGNIGVLSEFERANFETDRRNVKIKANITKYDILDVREEKFGSLEENANNKLVKIPAESYKFETFENIATALAKTEKDISNKSNKKAIDILLGKGKGKKSELYDYLSKMGIKPETIASQYIVDTVALRTLKDLELNQTKVDNKTSSVAGIIGSGKKEEKNKKDDKKKDDKKKDDKKKDDKKKDSKKKDNKIKDDKKEEVKSESSGATSGASAGGESSKTEKNETPKIKTRTLDELNKPKNNKAGMLGRMAGQNLKVGLKVGQDFLKREEAKQVLAGANSDATLNVTSTTVKVNVRQYKVTTQSKNENLNSL